MDQVRRIAVAAQGYASGDRRAAARDVERAVRRLSCVQLDSIATVERSHKLALYARVGRFPRDAEWRLMREGRLFEYWAHEACLVHVDDYPLFRRRMRARREHHWWGPVLARDPALVRRVLRVVRERGPVRSDDFAGRNVGMWGLKPEKRVLDALWTAGRLAIAGREGFVRLYDLPGRVLPASALRAPAPSAPATLRALAVRAVEARGALTARGIVEHYRLEATRRDLEPHLRALVRSGLLAREGVADGGEDVFVAPGADLDPPEQAGAVLVPPFDNLLWDRAFARRVLGFDHLIEVYKPAPQRRFGYYVMPLVARGRVAARVDLKADRGAGALHARAVHWEGRPERDALREAMGRLAGCLGLEPAPP